MSKDITEPVFDSKGFLKSVTSKPGVYQMFDNQKKIIYVGKAKNLKKRLSSYFRKTGLTSKTRLLVSHIDEIEVTVTHRRRSTATGKQSDQGKPASVQYLIEG